MPLDLYVKDIPQARAISEIKSKTEQVQIIDYQNPLQRLSKETGYKFEANDKPVEIYFISKKDPSFLENTIESLKKYFENVGLNFKIGSFKTSIKTSLKSVKINLSRGF